MNEKYRVLIVDDEASMRELLEIVLTNDGYDVTAAPDVAQAIAILEEERFDIVLTDLRMGSQHQAGMEVLSWLEEHEPSTPAIMMTAYGSVETAIEAMKRGAADYVTKPFKNDEVKLLLKRALEQRALKREHEAFKRDQAARGEITNIVGTSKAVEDVREMMRRVAHLPSTVAIHGESGTGKELVARGIHQLSGRAEKPFVAINCGGFPETLLESELFGHKIGSFTGAVDDKEGLFVTADGGTLFLDEMGEMPLALQVKLLRVLDDNTVLPVGGTTPVPVNVRIISATNRVLEKMVEEGGFREDLFYRLNVIPITVPPLRDRAEDIPLLATHFVETHAKKMGREKMHLSAEAMKLLQHYPWPGNVRELMNALERAVALCHSDTVDIGDLPPNVQSHVGEGPSGPVELPENGFDLERYIEGIETDLIQRALERAKYSQKRAAELLGLTSRSLRYRLKKYDLSTDN